MRSIAPWRYTILSQTGHPVKIHIRAVQFVHKRGTHTQRALLKNCMSSLCSKISVVIWCDPHEHFLFFTYLSYHTQRTLRTSRTFSKLTQSTSCAHQESLRSEDLQSGRNSRTTTPTAIEGDIRADVTRQNQEFFVLFRTDPEQHRGLRV